MVNHGDAQSVLGGQGLLLSIDIMKRLTKYSYKIKRLKTALFFIGKPTSTLVHFVRIAQCNVHVYSQHQFREAIKYLSRFHSTCKHNRKNVDDVVLSAHILNAHVINIKFAIDEPRSKRKSILSVQFEILYGSRYLYSSFDFIVITLFSNRIQKFL